MVTYQQYLNGSNNVERGTKRVGEVKENANSSTKLRTKVARDHEVGSTSWGEWPVGVAMKGRNVHIHRYYDSYKRLIQLTDLVHVR